MIDPIDDRRQAARLVEELNAGRNRAEDRDLALLGDTPLEVAGHMASRRVGITTDQLRQEFRPAWQLAEFARREADRTKLALIEGLLLRGATWSDIAELLDLNSRQAAEALHKRLQAGCAGGLRDPGLVRGLRRDQGPPAGMQAQQARRGEQVRAVLASLLQLAELLPADLEQVTGFDVDDLARLARPDLVGGDGAAAQTRVVLRELAQVEDLNEQVRAAVVAGADLLGVKLSSAA